MVLRSDLAEEETEVLEEITKIKSFSIGWDITVTIATLWLLVWLPLAVMTRFEEFGLFISMDIALSCVFLLDNLFYGKLNRKLAAGPADRFIRWSASIPIYAIAAILGWKAAGGPLIELNHLLILPILYRRIKWHSENTFVGKGVKAVLILCVSALLMHWIACAWMLLHPLTDMDMPTRYNHAIYWTVTTLTTVGYGDITPDSNMTRLFTIAVMLLGVGFYGVVIGQVSRYMVTADKRKEEVKAQVDALVAFCKHYQVPPKTQLEAMKYFRHLLAQDVNEQERKIISQLPKSLQSEIEVYMNIKPLSRVSLFAGCSQQCLEEAASMLERRHCSPKEPIIVRGEEAHSMYVVGFGRVVVHMGENKIAELVEGDCFGEMALILERRRRSDVTTITHCDLFRLSQESFRTLVSKHADLRANVDRMVEERSQTS